MTKNRRNTAFVNKGLKILSLTLIIFLTVSLSSAQADDQSEIDVTVEVGDETIIDIQPERFEWGTSGAGILPGTAAGPDEEQNDRGKIFIENLGSVDITEIWVESSSPDTKPFGTGDPLEYDPGNFLTISRDGGDTQQFINRREFGLDTAEDGEVTFLEVEDGWEYGRFRNTSFEYFWAVDEASGDNGALRITTEFRDDSQTGATDLSGNCAGGDGSGDESNTDCNHYDLSADSSASILVGDVDETGAEGEEYCAIADFESSPPNVDFVKWEPTMTGAQSGGCEEVTEYVVDSGGEALVPGEFLNLEIRSHVPFGVASGSLADGQLTVYANSG